MSTLSTTATRQAHELNAHLMTFRDAHDQSAGKKTPRGDPAVAIRSKPMSSKRAGKKGLSNGSELLILDSSAVFFAINFNRSLRTWPHSRCLKYLTDHIKRVKIPIVVIDEVYGKIDRDGGTDEDRIKIEKFADCIDDDSSIDLNILNQLEDIQKEVVKNPNSNKAKEWRKKAPVSYTHLTLPTILLV